MIAEEMIYTYDDIELAASLIANKLQFFNIVLFYGEMGSGKTTLIKKILKSLGYDATTSSPTFSLINQYDTNHGTIYHMDLYRLKSIEEALSIGIEDYLYSNQKCLIEWPQLIEPLLYNENLLKIKIDPISDFERKINITD